jgi:hypothetical protein
MGRIVGVRDRPSQPATASAVRPSHSYLNATIGSTREALRAGIHPAKNAAVPRTAIIAPP